MMSLTFSQKKNVMIALFISLLLVVVTAIDVANAEAHAHNGNNLRATTDPDTTCTDAYRKSPSKDTCLSTQDHFFRPCEYCTEKSGNIYCYNADEAKWAKWFDGATCEIPSKNIVVVNDE